MASKIGASTYLGGTKPLVCTHTCLCSHTEASTHLNKANRFCAPRTLLYLLSTSVGRHIVPVASSPRLSEAVDPIRRFFREVLARGRSSFDGSLSSEYQVSGLSCLREARQGDQDEIGGSRGMPVRKESDRPHTQF